MFLIPQLFVSAYLANRLQRWPFLSGVFEGLAWRALCVLTGDYAAIFNAYEEVA